MNVVSPGFMIIGDMFPRFSGAGPVSDGRCYRGLNFSSNRLSDFGALLAREKHWLRTCSRRSSRVRICIRFSKRIVNINFPYSRFFLFAYLHPAETYDDCQSPGQEYLLLYQFQPQATVHPQPTICIAGALEKKTWTLELFGAKGGKQAHSWGMGGRNGYPMEKEMG